MTRRLALPTAALLLAALFIWPVAMAGQSAPTTFLAVMDTDGVLTPIAIRQGQDWWNKWPWGSFDALENLPVPASLAEIPADWLPDGVRLPTTWTILRPDGRRASVNVVEPTRLVGMMATIGLRTTFKRDAGESFEHAAAVSGPGTLGRFVTPSANEAGRIRGLLRSTIAKIQADEIRRWLDEIRDRGDKVPTLTRVRQANTPTGVERVAPGDPLDIQFIRAETPEAGGRYYYRVDGTELYTVSTAGGCKMNLSTSGVVVVAAGRVVSQRLFASAWAEFCGDGAEGIVPIATVRIAGKTLWIVEYVLEDGFEYLLLDPDSRDPVNLKGLWSMRAPTLFTRPPTSSL